VTLSWKWIEEPHVVQLVADPANKIKETFEQNNSLVHDTYAKVLLLQVTQDTYDRMNNCPNHIGTYSCEDQLNWHINHMNEMFKNAIYPMTPKGSRERVRAEFLVMPTEADMDKWAKEHGGTVLTAGYDGGWRHNYGENTATWASNHDWGLPHELGHQLGIIDLYQLDCSANGNRAVDEEGDPVMIGHWCDMIDSMMHGHGPVPWSEHTAYASDTHFMKRRGFYGGYLVAMPKKNYVQVLDNQLSPVEGAKIIAYQTEGNRVTSDPIFTGTTGKDGKFLLPNRPIKHAPYVTELGYDFHDNPFGPIFCVGGNGLIFFRIEARGQIDYKWLEITRLNLAYWKGEKEEATYVYGTHIPHDLMPPTPQITSVTRDENGVKIKFTQTPDAPGAGPETRLSPQDKGYSNSTVHYNIYRAVPDPYNWTLVGTTTSRDPGEFTDKNPPQGMVRYAVTAVNTAQSESEFSKHYGYSVLGKPMGICLLPNGRLVLADHVDNQLIYLKPNGSVIGPWNSEHNHGYCTDVAVAKDGMVAYTDWPDGYDPKHVGFFLHSSTKHEMGDRHEKPMGSGDDEIAEPTGIAFDDSGNVILTDSGNNRVVCYTRDASKILWKVATGLSRPSKAIMWQGMLAIADTGNDRVQIVDPAGTKTAITISGLKSPSYVALDDTGRLIVSDTGNGALKIYTMAGGSVKEVGTFTGDASHKLQQPIGVTSLGKGAIAVVDAGTKSIVFGKLD
jgi:hypothetical protein